MTTLNVQLTHICSGGGHLTFTALVDGGESRIVNTDVETITGQITEQDMETFIKVMVKLYKKGRTVNQVKTGLQAGLGVTL